MKKILVLCAVAALIGCDQITQLKNTVTGVDELRLVPIANNSTERYVLSCAGEESCLIVRTQAGKSTPDLILKGGMSDVVTGKIIKIGDPTARYQAFTIANSNGMKLLFTGFGDDSGNNLYLLNRVSSSKDALALPMIWKPVQ